jgi:hypothetical protein
MRPLWRVVLTIGVLLFLISLTADSLGIGEGTGIGWKQICGAAAGVIIAAIGLVRLRR